VYLDTRYFQEGQHVNAAEANDSSVKYKSYTHAAFLRNAHAQELLLRESSIVWRTLGGSIDLYFYSGPTAEEAIKSYQQSTIGLPAMQQYWTFGFHQCRWGYQNWSVLQGVVDDFKKFSLPLETIWSTRFPSAERVDDDF
jgi:alpha-glucosidase